MYKLHDPELPGMSYLFDKLGEDNTAYILTAIAAIIYTLGFIFVN